MWHTCEDMKDLTNFDDWQWVRMLHAGVEALFGRNRDGHRSRNIFHLCRPHHHHHHRHTNEHDDLAKFFSNKPHLDKELFHGSAFAFAAMQGWRSSMEDKHKHLLCLDPQRWKSWAFFAIFDGHHGKSTMMGLRAILISFATTRHRNGKTCIKSIGYSSVDGTESFVGWTTKSRCHSTNAHSIFWPGSETLSCGDQRGVLSVGSRFEESRERQEWFCLCKCLLPLTSTLPCYS